MREQSHSANTENIVNHDVDRVDKLQQEFNELKQILYTLVAELGGGGGGTGGSEPPASRTFTSRLPPFFAFLPSPSKLEGFKTRISHKAVPGRTILRPFIIHLFYYIYFD